MRLSTLLCLVSSLALCLTAGEPVSASFEAPATRPATQPATQPAARAAASPATQPSTQPAGEVVAQEEKPTSLAAAMEAMAEAVKSKVQPPENEGESDAEPAEEASADAVAELPAQSQGKFPTPAELIRQIKDQQAVEEAKTLVAQIDFSQPLQEQPTGMSLFGGAGGTDLRAVLDRFRQAESDADCQAVLLTFYNGGMMNFAQAQEIRGALNRLRRAGKRTFVYADTYDTTSYLVASAATDVCLMEGGEVFIPGVAIEPMFYRGTLDKLGIKPDYIQVGEYKGAEEPYTRTEPSPELSAEMNGLADAMYREIVNQIARGRNLRPSKVKGLIDQAMIPAKQAMQQGLVDHLCDADGLRPLMTEELSNDVRLDADYGLEDREQIDPENPFALLAMMQPREPEIDKPSIALVYAEGVISGGEGGGGGLLSEAGVGSETIRRAMRIAERDENVKAVVIRIDSPGGSALASEAMYQAVRRVAEKKPVIISIGGMAASGGYYLAVAGDHIVADPSAIVGSIGVVGGKLVLDGLYEKLGLSTTLYTRGRNADLFSETQPWDDRQERLIRQWMKSTYEMFTDRVMSTRGRKIDDIDAVARGRIFLARDAKKLGMVDELGGLELAMKRAARRAEMEEYEVVVLPAAQPDLFSGGIPLPLGQSALAGARAEAVALLSVLPPHVRQTVGQMVQLNELLAERPVVLMTPYLIRVR